MAGLQLEDGLGVEQRVGVDTSETKLKRIMWTALNWPKERYHLCIRNVLHEDEERYTISKEWASILRAQLKQRQPEKSAASGTIVKVRLKTTWDMFDGHVNANSAWSEQKAIVEFKKLAGVINRRCSLRVEDQAGTKVRFQINSAFTYTLVVAG
jgi:hypothetical protein